MAGTAEKVAAGVAPSPLQLPKRDTILAALKRAVANVPDKVYLDFEGDFHTFRDFDLMASRLAGVFEKLGIQPGEVVSSILDNNVDCMWTWFAANKAGAIWAPFNTALRRQFLSSQIVDSGCRLIVCEAHYLTQLAEVAEDCPELELVLVRGNSPIAYLGKVRVENLDNHRDAPPIERVATPLPSDISCILYTSGTTGPSKGCMISHNYVCCQSRQVYETTPFGRNEVIWSPMPLFHIGAITATVIPALLFQERASVASRFSVSGFWSEIERSGARVATILASMIPLLAKAPDDEAMKRCRGQLHSIWGLPFTDETYAIWRDRFGVKWINCFGYGQTEGGKVCTILPSEPRPPGGSQGRVADEFEARIVDDNGCELPSNTIGEVVYRPRYPDVMFSGYWKRPEATVEAWRNLWMHSGDLGRFDEDGYFYFVGRKKDSIRRRGENISSFECELVLSSHPHVKEAVVYGVPSPVGEDDVKATIMLKDQSALREEELARWCIDNFPAFAVPRYYEFVTEIPRTTTGKPMKYILQEAGHGAKTWDIENSSLQIPKHRKR